MPLETQRAKRAPDEFRSRSGHEPQNPIRREQDRRAGKERRHGPQPGSQKPLGNAEITAEPTAALRHILATQQGLGQDSGLRRHILVLGRARQEGVHPGLLGDNPQQPPQG